VQWDLIVEVRARKASRVEVRRNSAHFPKLEIGFPAFKSLVDLLEMWG
jgi:hypothetical protein